MAYAGIHYLFLDRHDRNMTVVSKLLRMAGCKQALQESSFWYCKDQVNIPVLRKQTDRIQEIIKTNKIKFRFIVLQHIFQLRPFDLIFIRKLNIMVMIYIHDIKIRFEQIKHLTDRSDRGRFINILEITAK